MRELGTFPNRLAAENFTHLLYQHEIESEIRKGSSTEYEVWIYNEDLLQKSQQLFKDYLQKSDTDSFKEEILKGQQKKKDALKVEKQEEKLAARMQKRYQADISNRVTLTIIVICALCFLLASMQFPLFHYFSYRFGEITQGEIWRLITPVFLHGSIFHLIFNMFWFFDFGRVIELDKQRNFFISFLIGAAIFCNTAQYLVTGPNFVGISGVVYALCGFIWMKLQFDTNCCYNVSRSSIFILIAWFFIALSNIFGPTANTHHGAGICWGMCVGFLDSGFLKQRNKLKNLSWHEYTYAFIPILFLLLGIIFDRK